MKRIPALSAASLALLATPVLAAQAIRPAPPVSSVPDRIRVPGVSETVKLSPFVVEEGREAGYYASQTLSGGRLKQELEDIGASIQIVTKELMEDIGATGVEELFQYTTSTEVGGILGNFTGSVDGQVPGATTTNDARRDPEGTSRIRGLPGPDRTRNFFLTDIPFDSYNTDRVDINRGANSFLFGLGSPSGLINNGMAQARFKDENEVGSRVGSGGKNLSYRASFNLNRIVVRDRLAIHVAGLTDRTQYRQEPTHKNDDRQYGAFTFRPFRHSRTVIRAHLENGRIRGNAPDVLLPQQTLNTFLTDPVVGRLSINVYDNIQRFNHPEGPTQAQYNALSAAEKQRYVVRNTPQTDSLAISQWGPGSWGLVYDGRNGSEPSFGYIDQYSGAIYLRGDPFWNRANTGSVVPYGVYHGDIFQTKGPGWSKQGFTDLETFDFSRANLGWDNDYYTRDFFNYNGTLEQTLWEGKGGFEVTFDFQDIYSTNFTAFNSGINTIRIDINETLMLPADPNYLQTGNATPMPNPNYGRPFILSKSASTALDRQREAARLTGFIRHDFADNVGRGWLGRLLGRHTLTMLADKYRLDEQTTSYGAKAFGDPDPGIHQGPAGARSVSNGSRNVPNYSYIGPVQPEAFTNPAFTLRDFILQPAKYQLHRPDDYTINMLTWNLGPDAATAVGNARLNGNERWVDTVFAPRDTPISSTLQRTKVTSFALNNQSFFLDDILVVNTGYREDTVRNQLNNTPPLIGIDQIPDLFRSAFRVEDGTSTKVKSDIFSYGGVLKWPKKLVSLPRGMDGSIHYHTSKNFIPAPDRVDQFLRPVDSPSGESKDYGVSIHLWDNKVVARLNWYDTALRNADAGVSGTFNQLNRWILMHWGQLNQEILALDANNDGKIDQAVIDRLGPGQDATVIYPNLARTRAARSNIEPALTEQLKFAYGYELLPDGNVSSRFPGTVTDTSDISATGFEMDLILNPTRSWRILLNAAKQETVASNIAPRMAKLVNEIWVPHLQQFGDLDWSSPAEAVQSTTVRETINPTLLQYLTIKGQEGSAQAEQRKWRFNAVTDYSFREGRLRGFSVGGALRWEDSYALGYPIIDDPRGIVVPDVAHPYLSSTETSVDLNFGYRRNILRKVDWRLKLHIRNVQNWDSDRVSAVRVQPDGSVARVRFDPPRQVLLTNTFRF